MFDLIICMLNDKAKAPTREPGSIGYDLYAFDDHTINTRETKIIPCGFHMSLPDGYGALVWDRSGMGSKGITVFGGVIDPNYRGQMGVILHNTSREVFLIKNQQKIAQMIIQKVELPKIKLMDMDEYLKIPSERGMKGLGSSDGQNTAESAQAMISGSPIKGTMHGNQPSAQNIDKKPWEPK